MSFMERVIGAVEARRNFGKILHEVETERGQFVVERNGEPVAAVVPVKLYRQWQRRREAFFETMRLAAERSGVASEEEAMGLALEAQRSVRAQK